MEDNIILYAIKEDWMVLLPMVFCAFILAMVSLDRWFFYQKNKRDIVQFIQRLQRELQRGAVEHAQGISSQLGGVVGDVAVEGLRILVENRGDFGRSFDIASHLASRKLSARLSAIGTIATIAPYLGLFATVFRILLTFGDLAKQQSANAAPQVMFGIGSALIATAVGLLIAIAAVALNNWFQSNVQRFEDDFQLLKLLFLSYAKPEVRAAASAGAY